MDEASGASPLVRAKRPAEAAYAAMPKRFGVDTAPEEDPMLKELLHFLNEYNLPDTNAAADSCTSSSSFSSMMDETQVGDLCVSGLAGKERSPPTTSSMTWTSWGSMTLAGTPSALMIYRP